MNKRAFSEFLRKCFFQVYNTTCEQLFSIQKSNKILKLVIVIWKSLSYNVTEFD